jgi:hypothetical protein
MASSSTICTHPASRWPPDSGLLLSERSEHQAHVASRPCSRHHQDQCLCDLPPVILFLILHRKQRLWAKCRP